MVCGNGNDDNRRWPTSLPIVSLLVLVTFWLLKNDDELHAKHGLDYVCAEHVPDADRANLCT